MSHPELSEHLARRDRIKRALVTAQEQRNQRPEIVETPHGILPSWNLFEIEQVHWAINAERAALGKQPIAIEEVHAVEQHACGHVDYTAKFALYAADLTIVDHAQEVWR